MNRRSVEPKMKEREAAGVKLPRRSRLIADLA
jgi:hypothetical protein